MSWRIDTSKSVEKFLVKNELTRNEIHELVEKAIRYFQGGSINIDIKKLKGAWRGFYRIRTGRVRLIVEFDFANSVVFIEEADWRGNVYK